MSGSRRERVAASGRGIAGSRRCHLDQAGQLVALPAERVEHERPVDRVAGAGDEPGRPLGLGQPEERVGVVGRARRELLGHLDRGVVLLALGEQLDAQAQAARGPRSSRLAHRSAAYCASCSSPAPRSASAWARHTPGSDGWERRSGPSAFNASVQCCSSTSALTAASAPAGSASAMAGC